MGWTLDKGKTQSQWDEFAAFLERAKNGEAAGAADIFGRPFRPAGAPAVTPQAHPEIEVNYHLLQVNQLYEAGVIDQQQHTTMVNNISG